MNCAYCEKAIEGSRHRDHVVPQSRGGADTADNCLVSCPSCNLSKSSKLPSEWRSDLPPWIYELESRLVQRYRMPSRAKGRTKASIRRQIENTLPCWFCGGGVGIDGYLEFYSEKGNTRELVRFNQYGGRELYGKLTHPRDNQKPDWYPIAVFSHQECGPNTGYAISIRKIIEWPADRYDVFFHIQTKLWCADEYLEAIQLAIQTFKPGFVLPEAA